MAGGDASVKVALTVAGSDSGGGAGVQADLKTFAALGVWGTSAVTAITAQNTQGVRRVEALAPDLVVAQIAAVREDFDISCVKIGMLATPDIADAVGAALAGLRAIYDPVMVASSGDALMAQGFVAASLRLARQVELSTPNLAEAARWLDTAPAQSEVEMVAQGRALLELGVAAVLMKGGHLPGKTVDLLVTPQGVRRFSAPRIASENLHGTGCVLSSALAAHIARGCALPEAVERAKGFVRRAIAEGRDLKLGKGPGPLIPVP
jgi:hydroxymethylpyrimidine/phosphomethylpyrimidine kinase